MGLRDLKRIKSCLGLELELLPGGGYVLHYCLLSLRGAELRIEAKGSVSGSLEEVLKALPSGIPVSLSLTGKGLLIRQAARVESLGSAVFQEVFPHTDPAAFYCQLAQAGDISWLSVCRREIVDELIAAFKKAGLSLLILSAGPFAVAAVKKHFNHFSPELVFNGHVLNFSDAGQLVSYSFLKDRRAPFPLRIDREILPEEYVVAYGTGFQLLMTGFLEPVRITIPSLENALASLLETKRMHVRAAAILAAFFLILLVNFAVFSFYHSRNEALKDVVDRRSVHAGQSEVLDQSVKLREKLLKKIGWRKGFRFSWVCDQMGRSMPRELRLEKLEINPVAEARSGQLTEPVVFFDRIEVSGDCRETDALNEWIYRLKDMNWVERVVLKQYKPDENEGGHRFRVQIELK
ncbi:hypothetical protein GS399_05380 [Pedobacter sp. HMF7647]|uniref:Uncharacterized protein n=1 Tax=Hufsiella arboris TaxID=2695275 RepID=A0A7K1Y751_9SPHI|nr:hypothetical protein [Hufsiella arboris]MXV50397.1 hypothetical protein [Hufsiella arboris]